MPRSLSGAFLTALAASSYQPAVMCQLTFSTGVYYVWSGVGSITYSGHAYLGLGQLGSMGEIKEGITVRADGTKLQLSGVDSTLLGDAENDIQVGAPAVILLAMMNGATVVDTCTLFSGIVSNSQMALGPGAGTITLELESKMINGSRANNRRYTSTDQNTYYPGDTFFAMVEIQNDLALIWKS